jgi:hypothetical protein
MRRPEIADACAILREGITFIDEFDDRNTIGHGSTFLLSAKTSLVWSRMKLLKPDQTVKALPSGKADT